MLKRIKHHWITSHRNDRGQPDTGQNRPSRRMVPNVPVAELIGAPDDRGVLNVGGRLGASGGPQAVRQVLAQYMLGLDGAIGRIELHEGFDIPPGVSLGAAHASVRRAVEADLRNGIFPVLIGGGHDYGYPHAGGASDAFKGRIALINVDAHLDVRPPAEEGVTSGSPFYLALEEAIVRPRNFVEFGIQEHCNDEAFFRYTQRKGVRVVTLDQARAGAGVVANFMKIVRGFTLRGLKVVVSFDVDSVQSAFAPAVSAPQNDGFSPAEFLGMARFAGEHRGVASVGFFELAPSLDENQRATRLVATAVHRCLCGLSRRGAGVNPLELGKRILKRRS